MLKMDKENINIHQKKFLENYARTLDIAHSADLAGYKNSASYTNVKKILDDPKCKKALDKIIKKSAEKLEITKAFIVQRYLKIIDYAFFEDENGLKDPQLALRALDGLCKQLGGSKYEDVKTKKSIFDSIEGLDPNKI